jgi:hypothetical protein
MYYDTKLSSEVSSTVVIVYPESRGTRPTEVGTAVVVELVPYGTNPL